MSKSKGIEDLTTLTARIFNAMLDDIIMDTVLQSHLEVVKSRTACSVCNTRCGLEHPTATSVQAIPSVTLALSRPATPVGDGKAAQGVSATGASTPSSIKADGSIYFECVNCQRQIASSRYAPHLSSCMGLGTGRRGAVRTNYPIKRSSPGRSLSPSDAANISDESGSVKGKGKSKSKRADEAEFNLKRKRPASPQPSPTKKMTNKRQKKSGSPITRPKSESDAPPLQLPLGSQTKVPSKLRESSTVASSSSGSPSRSSSESPVATPASSVGITFASSKPKRPPKKKAKLNGSTPKPTPARQPSPPRPQQPALRVIEPGYFVDVEGDETGSSTDTVGE